MKRGRALVAVSLVASLAAVAAVVGLRERAAAPAAEHTSLGAAPARPFELAWSRGTTYAYALRWKGDSHVVLPVDRQEPIEASFDIDGDLSLRCLGPTRDGAGTLFAAELSALRRHALRALGKDLLPSDEDAARELTHREAWLEVGREGEVRTIWLRREDPDVFKTVMQSALTHVGMTLPHEEQGEWNAAEWTVAGRTLSHYEWDANAEAGAGRTMLRTRSHYDELTGMPGGACSDCSEDVRSKARIELDPMGYLRAIHDEEALTVVRPGTRAASLRSVDAFDLTFVRLGTFAAPTDFELDRARLEARRPGVVVAGANAAAAVLEQRVAGLTYEQLTTSVLVTGLRGGPADPGFVTRASGLVIQHPEYAARLAAVSAEPATTVRSRALIIDILASAGTPEAQAAMRQALGSPAGKADPDRKMLVQRFSLVSKPDVPSADFVAAEYDGARARGDDALRFASAYALGAMTGKLSRAGDDSAARSFDAKLQGDLARAKTAKEKAALLTAIGGERRRESSKTLVAYAHDSDPSVRASVAGALRSNDTAEARAAVFELLGDADGFVQNEALGALDEREVGADDARKLADIVLSGGTPPANDAGLVSFLAKHANAGPDIRRMLAFVMQRTSDVQLQARIRYVLAQLGP